MPESDARSVVASQSHCVPVPQSLFQCEGFRSGLHKGGLALSRPSPIVYQCASTVVSISDLSFRPAGVPGLGLYNETGTQEAWYTQTILRFLFRHARCACVCAIFEAAATAATLQCSRRSTRVSLWQTIARNTRKCNQHESVLGF